MIKFQERSYSEYDAIRELYNHLTRNDKRFEVISKSYLPGILKGNSVVVEKFTSVTKVFGKDRYRMYLKVGSKAKMPDDVRLTKTYRDEQIPVSINLKTGSDVINNTGENRENSVKLYLNVRNSSLVADVIMYNKKQSRLILEMDSVRDASEALYVLPFGLSYKVYLLD